MKRLPKERVNPSQSLPAREIAPYRLPWRRLVIGLAILVLIVLLAGTQGAVTVPFLTVAKIVISKLPGVDITVTWPQSWDAIIWDLRLPRVLAAAAVGAALAVSGGAYQGLFRNPLADPYLIGAAAGAGLGATIVLVTDVPHYYHGLNLLALAAFVGTLAAISLAYILSRVDGAVSTTTLILAGIAVAALAGATAAFLLMRSTQDPRPVLAWLLGGFGQSTWRTLGMALPYMLAGSVITLLYGRSLNVMQLDEEQAQQLGIDVERTKMVIVAAASLTTAAAVSISGLIGFVGLIAPHAVRLLWGPDYRFLLPMSMLIGAGFLVLADLLARTAVSTGELPVGVVTAFTGAPFFLYILRRTRRAVF